MRPLRAVLFDWDGTLVDSAEASFRCYRDLFAAFGIAFEREHYARTYSPDWYRTYAAMGLPESCWDDADQRFVNRYAELDAALVPGAAEALGTLGQAGLGLGLVSSGERPRIERDLARFALSGRFAAVVCGTEAGRRKPHPDGLLLALERLGVAPDESAYVGDSPEDVEMARAAGALAVGVPGGFPNGDALRASAPEMLVGTVEEAVRQLLLRRA